MFKNATMRLKNPAQTRVCGLSLAASLYTPGTTVLLMGELGAGKTTFLQGLAQGLGVEQEVCSPTYALEQRYKVAQWGELLHIDLYRLAGSQAQELIESSDDHEGIRCIEWADRLTRLPSGPTIQISFTELSSKEREISCVFDDIALPTEKEIRTWQRDLQLTENIIAHCDKVGEVAEKCARLFLLQGKIARPAALKRAGQLHDLFRFVDFHRGSAHLNAGITDKQRTCWKPWQEEYKGKTHEQAVAAFLQEKGYEALATIIEPHGLKIPLPEKRTTEQKLLFYVDKRVKFDGVVPLEERFEDFKKRYADGKKTKKSKSWYEECRRLELELFPEGAPQI